MPRLPALQEQVKSRFSSELVLVYCGVLVCQDVPDGMCAAVWQRSVGSDVVLVGSGEFDKFR